jgi:predicted phosphoadenosine phosphosulfate sulfurtransferase
MARDTGNQDLAPDHHYGQHQRNSYARKITVISQIHHRKNYGHHTNPQNQKPITNANTAPDTKRVSPQLIMSKDVMTVSASNQSNQNQIRETATEKN